MKEARIYSRTARISNCARCPPRCNHSDDDLLKGHEKPLTNERSHHFAPNASIAEGYKPFISSTPTAEVSGVLKSGSEHGVLEPGKTMHGFQGCRIKTKRSLPHAGRTRQMMTPRELRDLVAFWQNREGTTPQNSASMDRFYWKKPSLLRIHPLVRWMRLDAGHWQGQWWRQQFNFP